MDGYWLSLLRRRVGPGLPIVCTLDPHANLSSLMVESVNATIACPTTGTLPYRTTDGSTPTTSSTQSSTATFSSSGTLKAICAGGGYAASAVASATYTITGGSGGLVMSSPLTLDKTIVAPGGTVNGTVTYQNTSSAAISLLGIAIAGRPPGGSNAGGPYDDLSPTLAAQTIAPGASVTLAASRAFTAGVLVWFAPRRTGLYSAAVSSISAGRVANLSRPLTLSGSGRRGPAGRTRRGGKRGGQ